MLSGRSKRRDISATGFAWSDGQKIEAVTTYFLLGGNLVQTSKALNIPEATMREWKTTQWWKDLEEEVRKEERMILSTKLKKILNKSWEKVDDILSNGEYVLNQKTGEVVRKPASLRDVNKVMTDAAQLSAKLNLEESHSVATETVNDKLRKLADAFATLSQGKRIEMDVEDIVYEESGELNAVHEGRVA